MNTHPLTARAFGLGALAGLVAAIVTSSALSGAAVFTLALIVGLTWRRDEVPVLPFLLSYQWLQVTSGYFYLLATDRFPDVYEPGDLDLAVGLGLLGLVLLAVAMRLVSSFSARHEEPQRESTVHNLRALLWLVLALYSVNFLNVMSVTTGGTFSVILDRLLQLRQVPLLLLWLEVVRQGRHRSYLWISLAWVFIPQLGSYFSDFKTPLILLVIVSAFFWQPWTARRGDFTFQGIFRVVSALTVAVFMAMIWQAGVKRDLRKAYDIDAVSANPIERVQLFVERAQEALPVVLYDTRSVVEGLVSRVSYVTFFSRVLEHVPAREPHADGELLQMAFSNAFMPRFLFPGKGTLPSDSYFTRRFAGVLVTDENTSISIGYLAEFYADWGMTGMLVSVFGYGLLMGLAVWCIRLFVPRFLMNPALVATMLAVLPFEHQFVKGLATLIMAVVLAIIATRGTATLLLRYLEVAPDAVGHPGDGNAQSNRRPTLRRVRPARPPM